ncbi:hypothetical protein LAQ65_10865 [Flavihumibacter profundi]|nr:hypothetical protein [Flavihumibacter profundi]
MQFLRIHKSYIVPISNVNSIGKADSPGTCYV